LFEEAPALVAPQEKPTFDLRQASSGTSVVKKVNAGENVLFVVDEVSQLLSKRAFPKKLIFRCLCKAAKAHMEVHPDSFFAMLPTCSSVSQLMPE